jgi:hypothetical protein
VIDALFRCWLITCETSAQPSRTRKRYVQVLYLSAGFGDCEIYYVGIARVWGSGVNRMIKEVLRGGGLKKRYEWLSKLLSTVELEGFR